MKVYKTKVISCGSARLLQHGINEFLENLPANFIGNGLKNINIQYSSFAVQDPENDFNGAPIECFSALILWEEYK